ncbi:MAG: type II secretion system F family protein [Bdellovibrionota bacterium]
MDKLQLFIILAMIIGAAGLAAFAYVFIGGRAGNSGQGELRDLMGTGPVPEKPGRKFDVDPLDLDVDTFKKQSKRKEVKSKAEDVPRKLFRAGFFSSEDRAWFGKFRLISFVSASSVFPISLYFVGVQPALMMVGMVLGVLIGYAIPMSWLEKQIRRREDEIMYFLPLVIEQVSIGVSSALDVGPCIAQIITMANERDSHNAVTEMFVHVEKLIRSGLNLEDALTEVGEANGMAEVKHAFMFLAQCSRHGGELSKQLQELADSVMTQRQVQIEGKIASLPVKATGPLATVFAGFFALLFAGLLVRLLSAFGG